ncbi:MAG: hypothetical protein EXS55_03035 [Candidatus Magasanikbacteria bacterium]|nr:hypothetical protein [Candidatus Magasanikbacteria bacterium]
MFLSFAAIVLGIVFVVLFISSLLGVPFLPTNMRQARLMMELAGIKPGMTVIDLGSGNGRLLFLAAKKGARAIGYELNPGLYAWTMAVAFLRGQTKLVSVKCRSLYDADLSEADVVLSFLMPGPMKKLASKLFSELKPGTTIVSYAFSIPGHEPAVKKEGIFVYKVC